MARPPVTLPVTPSAAQLVRGTGAAVLCTIALLALSGARSVLAVALVAVLSLGLGVLAAMASQPAARGARGRIPATSQTAGAARRREPARR